MKNVLFLIDSLNCGGAEKSLISLLPLLDYSLVHVDLMIVKRGGEFEDLVPPEVHKIDFPHPHGLRYSLLTKWFSVQLRLHPQRHGAETRWQALASAYSTLPQSYDVAVAYQQGFPTYFIAEKVKAEKKYAWINVDMKQARYQEAFNRRYYKAFNRVVAVSDVLFKMLQATAYVEESKLITVYDILNADVIRQMAQDPINFTRKENTVEIVTVGRMVYQKGYDIAVEVASILAASGLRFHWTMVGDGDMRPTIEKMIQEKNLSDSITLAGMQSNPYPYMAAADIYVQPSRFEGFGLTLAEARILHKPEVSTNFPVVYNQIRDGENGLIAEMTPASLAEKIRLLIHDDALRAHIIASTRQEVNTTAHTEPEKVMQLLLS